MSTVEEFVDILAGEHPPQFAIGDIISFQKADGFTHTITILGFNDDEAHIMYWDGQPIHLKTTLPTLEALRIVSVRRMEDEDLAMYRQWLGSEARQ